MDQKTLKLINQLKQILYHEDEGKIKKINIDKVKLHFHRNANQLTTSQKYMVNAIMTYIVNMKKEINQRPF